MRYDSNPKHSTPWQRGRRGSLCPTDINEETAQALLLNSEADGDRRYACRDGRAYRAQQHRPDLWHGYPVGWVKVPVRIRQKWRHEGVVRRSDIKRNWD